MHVHMSLAFWKTDPVRVNSSSVCLSERERVFLFSSLVPWSWECRSTLSREVLFLTFQDGTTEARSDETANTLEDIWDFLPHNTATAMATSVRKQAPSAS